MEDEWNSVADAKVIFKMAPKYSRSSWDWIGLYKVTCHNTALPRRRTSKDKCCCNFLLTCRWVLSTPRIMWGMCGPSRRRQIFFDKNMRWTRCMILLKHWFWSLLINIWVTLFQVTFIEEELPKGSGDYILGYYSNNMNTIVGVTEPFQVMIAHHFFLSWGNQRLL